MEKSLSKIFKKWTSLFGLNFLENEKSIIKDFMLLCGFESFDKICVRIDILERLFLLIFNSDKENQKEIKIVPEMLNLLGCNKDSFVKLLKKMNYKIFEKNENLFFKYAPTKRFLKNNKKEINVNDNPFSKLAELNIK